MSSLLNLFSDTEGEKTSEEGSAFWKLFEDPNLPLIEAANAPPPYEPCCQEQHFNRDKIFWTLKNIPARDALTHFLVCGVTGSGKSTIIQQFLQSIAKRFHPGEPPEQLIIFDAKCDTVQTLNDLGFSPDDENVYLLNPFDTRCAVWQFGEAIQEPALARHLSNLLIPEDKSNSGKYFTDAARQLVYATTLGLNSIIADQKIEPKRPSWTFRDLLIALESPDHVKQITARHPRARVIAQSIFGDEKHSGAVFSTMATKLGAYEQVASLWATNKSTKTFSIEKFLKKPGILVLGNDPVLKDSLWPINAILLKALAHSILRRENSDGPAPSPRHWFILDEFRSMQQVDCIPDLLNQGRSKGVSVVLGIQGIEGLSEVYGDMAGQVHTWAEEGFLSGLLKHLRTLGFDVFISADHGNTAAVGIGNPKEGVLSDKGGERCRIYSDPILSKTCLATFPETLVWNHPGLPDNLSTLLAPQGKVGTAV